MLWKSTATLSGYRDAQRCSSPANTQFTTTYLIVCIDTTHKNVRKQRKRKVKAETRKKIYFYIWNFILVPRTKTIKDFNITVTWNLRSYQKNMKLKETIRIRWLFIFQIWNWPYVICVFTVKTTTSITRVLRYLTNQWDFIISNLIF